jgi:hypothetical protein
MAGDFTGAFAEVLPGAGNGVFIEFFVTFYLNTMSDFNPDAASKSDVLFALTNKHERVRATFADRVKTRGLVVWDASVSDDTTIMRAFQHGLAMLRTDCTDEWVVAGSAIFALVRLLPEFMEFEKPEIACGLTCAGTIRSMRIYLLPWPKMPSAEFIIGHDGRFVQGSGINLPIVILEEDLPDQPARRARDPYEEAAAAMYNGIDPNDACFGIHDDDPPFDGREELEFKIPRRPPEDYEKSPF